VFEIFPLQRITQNNGGHLTVRLRDIFGQRGSYKGEFIRAFEAVKISRKFVIEVCQIDVV
jgi:hypothetical protein